MLAMASMLSPYRVLDLTDGRAELATFVLAGLGADVIKVEPPGGSPSRRDAPLAEGEDADLASLRFQAWNRGKRSVVLDLDDAAGRADLLALVASADFVFENAGPGVMDGRGLGFDALRAAQPTLVYVAISPFGQTGPYADHLATDLTLSAMGGAMALNGEPDRRPVRITVPQTWLHAAAESALGAMVAHERVRRTGEAQFVDVSVQAAVFWTGLNAMVAHAIQGRDIERNGTLLQLSTLTTPLVYPCLDGEVVLIATTATLAGLVPWMLESGAITQEWADAEDWSSYEARMLTTNALIHQLADVREAITRFTLGQTKHDLFEGGIARGVTIAPVNNVADVMAMEHLAVRGYWDELTLPSGRTVRTPGAFVKATVTPVAWTRPAPRVGEHTDEVLAEVRGAVPKRADIAVTSEPLPLAGVKVADFSWIGVGPITAKALADHGATVVHVEHDRPADRLRLVGPFKDDVPGINRCQFFASFNTSKLSLQLNLKHPEGNAVARQLLAWCDVAIDSFTAGTMASLGLGYEVARELNPGIIMATTCLMGQTGPAAELAGYGYHAAAVSGFYEITGWDDRPPAGPFNAYTDTIAPRFLATTLLSRARPPPSHRRGAVHRPGPDGVLAALPRGAAARRAAVGRAGATQRQRRSRRARRTTRTRVPVTTSGARSRWRPTSSGGRCGTVLGEPSWAMDPVLDTLAGRQANVELIDDRLGAFTLGPRAA